MCRPLHSHPIRRTAHGVCLLLLGRSGRLHGFRGLRPGGGRDQDRQGQGPQPHVPGARRPVHHFLQYRPGRRRSTSLPSMPRARQWNKPLPLPQFGSAAMAADGTLYLRPLRQGRFLARHHHARQAGWDRQVRRGPDLRHSLPRHAARAEGGFGSRSLAGRSLGAVRLAEDEKVGGKNAVSYRAMVFRAGRD